MAALGPWQKEYGGGFVLQSPPAEAPQVRILDECGSTMDEAWARASSGDLADWGCVLAARQRRGRGQLRRGWIAPPGNLSVSFLLPCLPEPLAPMASLLVGHAAAEALETEFGIPLRIKWPNDLLLPEGKVGGILIEERQGLMVAGLGLNLFAAPPGDALRADHAHPAASLPSHPEHVGPLGLWLRLSRVMRREILRCCDEDRSALLPDLLMKRLAYAGDRVVVADGAERFEARVLGIAGDGGLVVETFGREGAVCTLYSGCLFPL